MFTKALKQFKQVEPQLLRGQYAGLYISQRPVKYTAEGSVYGVPTVDAYNGKYIENGIICGLDNTGKIVSYTEGTMFIHYTEELTTVVNANNTFAVEGKGDETYIRLIQLFPGDEFVTDNFSGTGNYGVVTNGVITLSATATGAKFYCEDTTLADGTAAKHVVVLG
jgi:hypothetical protein